MIWTNPKLSEHELKRLEVAWASPVLGYSLAERIEEGKRYNDLLRYVKPIEPRKAPKEKGMLS